jgi:hypothetical protein
MTKVDIQSLAQFLLYLMHLKTSYYNAWFWRYSCQSKNSDLLKKMVKALYSLDQSIFMWVDPILIIFNLLTMN